MLTVPVLGALALGGFLLTVSPADEPVQAANLDPAPAAPSVTAGVCPVTPTVSINGRYSVGYKYKGEGDTGYNLADSGAFLQSYQSDYVAETYLARIKPGTSNIIQYILRGYDRKSRHDYVLTKGLKLAGAKGAIIEVKGDNAWNLTFDQGASLASQANSGGNPQSSPTGDQAYAWKFYDQWSVPRSGLVLDTSNTAYNSIYSQWNTSDSAERDRFAAATPRQSARLIYYNNYYENTKQTTYLELEADPSVIANSSGNLAAWLALTQQGTSYYPNWRVTYLRFTLGTQDAPHVKLNGFYDSPYLDPAVYGTPADQILPQGMKLEGAFWNYYTGQKVQNLRETVGNECHTYASDISFSGDNLKQVWDKFGQRTGRKFYLSSSADIDALNRGMIGFEARVYEDAELTTPADGKYKGTDDDWTAPGENADTNRVKDRMRVGYVKAQRTDGSVVPVKVMYYPEANAWNKWNNGGRTYRYHIRPYVLNKPDDSLPLNPVAVSPYRSLIKWLKFDDAQLQNDLKAGETISRELIPGFLTVKCDVRDFEAWEAPEENSTNWSPSTLDAWSPGFYYQDGAPWLIGDEQTVGVHQTGFKNKAQARLACWAERQDPGEGTTATPLPIGAFVALDAESTDGGYVPNSNNEPFESLSMANTDGDTIYPIAAYSSCSTASTQGLRSLLGDATVNGIQKAPAFTKAWTGTLYGKAINGIEYFNGNGRCGELNGMGGGTANADPSMPQYGSLFGPALMAVAPVDPENYNLSSGSVDAVKKEVVVAMKGRGKEALGFGAILGGDTSNADFSQGMPAAFQLNSLSFNAQLQDTSATVDWTEPSNHNQNFFYYGARLGKRATSYDPNIAEVTAGTSALTTRDGRANDSQPNFKLNIQLGNDTRKRVQPKVKPISENDSSGNTYYAYTTDLPGKYLVGQDAKLMSVAANGATLVSAGRSSKPVTITVPCGKNYVTPTSPKTTGTTIRAWADFNGNGMFDPDEISSVGTCEPQQSSQHQLQASTTLTNDLPWTDTQSVQLTFKYPTQHFLNGKRNVWMRIRAVDTIDAGLLTETAARERKAVASTSPYMSLATKARAVNPDADAPRVQAGTTRMARAISATGATAETLSAPASSYGSWRYTPTGETEDYLFDITPPAEGQDDLMCIAKTDAQAVVDVVANDKQADGRMPDPASVRFLADQVNGVTVSNEGSTATVAGEGTYTVNATTGVITFAPAAQLQAKQNALTTTSQPVTLTPVRYAFNTADGAEVYDRVTAASATLRSNLQYSCNVQAQASLQRAVQSSFRWDLDKTVLKGDTGSEYVKEDNRLLGEHTTNDKVGLSYKLLVTAKKYVTQVAAITGSVTLLNPTDTAVTTANTNGVTLQVSGADSTGLSCTFTDPSAVNGLTLPANSVSTSFTYSCTKSGALPTGSNITVTPVLHLQQSVSSQAIAAVGYEQEQTLEAQNARVRFEDGLDGDGVAAEGDDLGDLTVQLGSLSKQLSTVQLYAPDFVGTKDKGTQTLTFTVPSDRAPNYTAESTQVIWNTAVLCDAEQTSYCAFVPQIPSDGGSENVRVPPSEAYVIITKEEHKPIYIKKTGIADDAAGTEVPLSGSEFKIFNDVNGNVGTEVSGEPQAVSGDVPASAAGAQFIFNSYESGKWYWLMETKAPAGHQLLAQPVRFKVENGQLTLGDGKSDYTIASSNDTLHLLTVRDVEDGELPAFGGPGLIVLIGAGVLLLLLALLLLRKTRKPISSDKEKDLTTETEGER